MAARTRPPASPSLFEAARSRAPSSAGAAGDVPLADRVRPRSLAEVVGQRHLLGPGKVLARAIADDRVPPMILWGPPGSGKTTIGRVIAEQTKGRFTPYSAVNGSVPELRGLLAEASEARLFRGERTILFIDEIHRFNKAQQDALLPDVEKGTVVLVGATTENPSFAVNAALLSRCRVFRLEAVPDVDVVELLRRALADAERGLGALGLTADDAALEAIAQMAGGDARRALGTLDLVAAHARAARPGLERLTRAEVDALGEHRPLLYDKAGEEHYNVSSALIKSLRGGDPDAAIYWLFRMMEAGDDPLFLSRRLVIFASEDVGNADPRALEVAVAADAAYRRLGMPEGAYPLAHACLYLACAPKSNGVKRAMKLVREAIEASGPLPVPMKLRNAPTKLMRSEGYGQGYRDPHAFEGHVAPGETYLPDALVGTTFYQPTEQGFERRLREILAARRAARGGRDGEGEVAAAPGAREGEPARAPATAPGARDGEPAGGDAPGAREGDGPRPATERLATNETQPTAGEGAAVETRPGGEGATTDAHPDGREGATTGARHDGDRKANETRRDDEPTAGSVSRRDDEPTASNEARPDGGAAAAEAARPGDDRTAIVVARPEGEQTAIVVARPEGEQTAIVVARPEGEQTAIVVARPEGEQAAPVTRLESEPNVPAEGRPKAAKRGARKGRRASDETERAAGKERGGGGAGRENETTGRGDASGETEAGGFKGVGNDDGVGSGGER